MWQSRISHRSGFSRCGLASGLLPATGVPSRLKAKLLAMTGGLSFVIARRAETGVAIQNRELGFVMPLCL